MKTKAPMMIWSRNLIIGLLSINRFIVLVSKSLTCDSICVKGLDMSTAVEVDDSGDLVQILD